MIHEFGHVLALLVGGVTDFQIILNPFIGSRVIWDVNPNLLWLVNPAGWITNISLSTLITLVLWRKRKPVLLPFLMWSSIAYIQEGLTILMDLSSPGSDAAIQVLLGTPSFVLVILGLILFVGGIIVIWFLFPLLNISSETKFWDKFIILVIGFSVYMVAVVVYASSFAPFDAPFQVPKVIFTIILAFILSALYKPLKPLLEKFVYTATKTSNWMTIWITLGLSGILIIFQLLLFN
jgi:hypothetical protein